MLTAPGVFAGKRSVWYEEDVPDLEGDVEDKTCVEECPSTVSMMACGCSDGAAPNEVNGMRYQLEVRLTAADIGNRVVVRWRPPELDDTGVMTDVLGILEEADDQFFRVRRSRDGQLVVIPRKRALAGKVVPPAKPARRPRKHPEPS